MENENGMLRFFNSGLKNTKARIKIIELLENNRRLLTTKEIHKRLLKAKLRINLSTVYRTLDKMVENKLVNRVTIENEKQALYEYNRNEHHHFLVCKACNKIYPIYECPLDEYEKKLKAETGFTVTGHHIEFYGYCRDCQKLINEE